LLPACLQNSNVGNYNSRGFVEVLAASQTTTTKEWFQVGGLWVGEQAVWVGGWVGSWLGG
jgi:hypothetical protein